MGLLKTAYKLEVSQAGLGARFPPDHVLVADDFDASPFDLPPFDFVWAHSLVTHLDATDLLKCLRAVASVTRPGGTFAFTAFVVTEAQYAAGPRPLPPRIPGDHHHLVTMRDADPYHFTEARLRTLGEAAGLETVRVHMDVAHPRWHNVVEYRKPLLSKSAL